MSKNKKSKNKSSESFHVYKSLPGLISSNYNKELNKLKPNEFVGFAATAFGGEYDTGQNDLENYFYSQNFRIAASELPLMLGNVPCVFPESKKMLDTLNKCSYKFNKFVSLSFPMDKFTLAMPKGIMVGDREVAGIYVQKGSVKGLELQPMLDVLEEVVNFKGKSMEHLFSNKEENQKFLESIRDSSIEIEDDRKLNASEQVIYDISMEFIKPNKKTNFINMKMEEHLLSLALKADSSDQLLKLVKLYEKDNGSEINNNLIGALENDKYKDQIYYSLRTIASVGVYLSLDANKLKEGLPGKFLTEAQKTKVGKILPDSYMIESTKAIESAMSEGKDNGEHYRMFHFRNLRHEKYYKNEHEDKAIGSRWTFVSDSLVNAKEDAMTITK